MLKVISVSGQNQYPTHFSMPFEVKSFYKTSISRGAFDNHHLQQRIFTPNPQVSDDEDCDDGTNVFEDSLLKQTSDGDASLEQNSESEFELDAEIDSDRSIPHEIPVPEAKTNKKEYKWKRMNAADVDASYTGAAFPNPPDDIPPPVEYFHSFFGKNLMAVIAEQTNLYPVQCSGKCIQTNEQEIEQFIGILVMMGITKYPQYRMYWSPETYTPVIADTMSLTRFENLKRFLHFNDNSQMPADNCDKLFKLRPILDSILSKCRSIPQEESHSVDEQIIPTKCRSSLRQYLPKKPHKWGFKVWARCGVSGIIYDFEVYTGKQKDKQEFGKVGSVVKRLVSSLPKNVGHKVFFDNLFSSVELVQSLKEDGIYSVGTIRANRLQGAQKVLKGKKELEKLERGAHDFCVDSNSKTVLVRWHDNGIVTLVSSYIGSELGDPVKRWSKEKNAKIDVPCPKIVAKYNQHMGGVDLCDMLLALYRIQLGTCKWYMHLMYYLLGICIVNGWLLYRRH